VKWTAEDTKTPLTAAGGQLDEGDGLRAKCAIWADGRVIVARHHSEDSDIAYVIAAARRMGVPIGTTEYVDLGRIREAYAGSRKAVLRNDVSARPMSEIRQEVINQINDAVSKGATDLILVVEPEAAYTRLRIDGECTTPNIWQGAAAFGHQLCRAAYTACTQNDANYDATRFQSASLARDDERNPFAEQWPTGVQALRMHFNPVGPGGRGRNLALRILYDRGAVGDDFAGLGFAAEQEQAFRALMEDGSGLAFFSGPTGSGKTTGLECLMRSIGTAFPGENLMSVEDPPEFKMPGVIQLAVTNTRNEEDRSEAFTEAIAGCMRSNPDRMMVGEVRARASASLLFQFALTGHPAYSTIHANDALGIPSRLAEMGVERYLLRDPSIVRFLEAQRLVRRLCPACKVAAKESQLESGLIEEVLSRQPDARFFVHNPDGCGKCRGGFVGRTVVAEYAQPDETLLSLLIDGRRTDAEVHWADRLGGKAMVEHGITKVAAGEVSARMIRFDRVRSKWDLRKVGRT
jgi:type II secretory ATPase GspE/PulE/Tfp pilus assembly ATPase PilB-like protein